MVDKTGEPRSDEEIQEAIKVLVNILVKKPLVLPELTVQILVIKDGLTELLKRRVNERGGP